MKSPGIQGYCACSRRGRYSNCFIHDEWRMSGNVVRAGLSG
ncbi:hypothetical protein [Sideroxydans sp. CL21]|nr:hypothetical protein [Sideroxydans sp. CL21]